VDAYRERWDEEGTQFGNEKKWFLFKIYKAIYTKI
jgi:hypothetical protein